MTNYQTLAQKIEPRSGWNFSEVELETENSEEKWDYREVVEEFLDPDQTLLDLGTGGGEFLLKIADQFEEGFGVDIQASMINTSKENLRDSNVDNVEFNRADSKELPFPDGKFDIVICRHAPFTAKEVYRVLKEKGIFITQQVRENDKQNIKRTFKRGQSFDKETDVLFKRYLKELKEAGFQVLRKDRYNVDTYLKPIKDVIALLKWSPIISDFDLDNKKDRKSLEKIENKFKTERGIKTNSSRFLIVVKK